MSELPEINLTDEAKELIVNLVKIDINSKEQKNLLFLQLLELWKQDTSTGFSSYIQIR